MSANDPVLTEMRGAVRVITLNRPDRLNAINESLLIDLHRALRDANADSNTNVIALRGAGSAFCAGKDLKDHEQTHNDATTTKSEITLLQDISREILFGEKIVIAGVHGWAAGGGLELMLNCDLVLLSENARMFFPEMSLGLFITCGATCILPRIVGLSRAKALMLTGERLDAKAARDLGLAWKVVPDARLQDELLSTASKLSEMPQQSQRQLKMAAIEGVREELEHALKLEAEIAESRTLDETSRRLIQVRVSNKTRLRVKNVP